MKFIYFLFSVVALTACVYANDQEVYLPSDCYRPVEYHPNGIACMALIPVWRWDVREEACVRDTYGGCNPTNNNFPTLKECNQVARPVCENSSEEVFRPTNN
ncbi:male accessory gland serine protease inhibitor-like [Diabrotica virgifera virgifera]|uniref:Male accessory gland serine protease inhibitor-like n=1 Tax=Diabrotica virgifera virgifera TaxID=50390 RepID=A0A6P7FYL6_DIAVI|nr:male accessory gland serine protease inhibitor-like [Diabrotica virgifera virgifera]